MWLCYYQASAIKMEILCYMGNNHKVSETIEDQVMTLTTPIVLKTDCVRCGVPLKVWVEQDQKEDEYCIQVDEGELNT